MSCYQACIYRRLLFCCILHYFIWSAITLGPSSFPNAARQVHLVLYQGKRRYEITGRSCPLGIKLVKPESFSCACVAGVWAFYDMKCAAPYQIIAGLNHCFKLPPNAFFHQIINVGNPTRSHGNSLAFFDGELEAVKTKFYRETHSRMATTDQVLTTGQAWTLRSLNEKQTVCLDASKHPILPELDESSWSSSSLYCIYTNVTRYIPEIGSVSTGCDGTVKKKIEPQSCFPFLGTISEDICTEASLLQAYETAMRANQTVVPLERLPQAEYNISSVGITGKPSAHDVVHDYPTSSASADQDKSAKVAEDKRIDPLFATQDDVQEPNNELASLRQGRKALNTEHDNSGLLTPEEMHARYMYAVENEENFLKPSAEEDASHPVIFQLVMDHQRMRIREALQLEDMRETEESNAELLLRKSSYIMSKQCPNVPQEFLNLATSTFARLLRRFNYQHKLIHSIDVVVGLLGKCKFKNPPYEFIPTGAPCEKNVPTHVLIGGKAIAIKIPQVYKSATFEPILETVWKLTVHTLLYCHEELSKYVNPATEMAIAFSEMLSSDVNLMWKRNKAIEEEYGGVIGDMRKLLEKIDACVTTAAMHTNSNLLYARPPYKPTVPPEDTDYEISENGSESSAHQIGLLEPNKEDKDFGRSSAESYGEERKRARREASQLDPEEAKWRKERGLFGIGYCLKKFDEPLSHFEDNNCDEK